MAEGPSIVLLRERAGVFVGKTIRRVEGDAPIDTARLVDQRIVALRTFGKHFLVELAGFTLRVHLLMLGSYCIDERKDKPIRLGLGFAGGREINFYSCSVKFLEEPLDDLYDWRADVLSDRWDAALARKKLRAMPEALVCDALLDQTVFAGVGNVIKNEVLFRIRVHPLATVGSLPAAKLRELVAEARGFTFEFYAWKKADVDGTGPVWRGDTLASHWLVHDKKTCPRCDLPLIKAYTGALDRRSFWCERCQPLDAAAVSTGARPKRTRPTPARGRSPRPTRARAGRRRRPAGARPCSRSRAGGRCAGRRRAASGCGGSPRR